MEKGREGGRRYYSSLRAQSSHFPGGNLPKRISIWQTVESKDIGWEESSPTFPTSLLLYICLPFQGAAKGRYVTVGSRTQRKVSSGSFCCQAGFRINCSLLYKFRVHQCSDAVRASGLLSLDSECYRPTSGWGELSNTGVNGLEVQRL